MKILRSPYRFLIAAAVLAAILCLLPMRADAPGQQQQQPVQTAQQEEAPGPGLPAGADLSERTSLESYLHRTLYYAPCGHSVQRREKMPAALAGLTREAFEAGLGGVIPGATVTGFSGDEVDISVKTDIPCPLHWVLRSGENGRLEVLQNTSGEALEVVRQTDIELTRVAQAEQAALVEGRVFDDVQALEGYLESLSS